MICFPNAKINLGLNIVSKRTDGYHNLETVFYPIGVKDALEVIERKEAEDILVQSGIEVDAPSCDNLVMKAVRLLRQNYDFPPIEVHLLKKIPFGAGLGGGSADAAFMLKLLNQKFGLKISDNELIPMAAKLGADCPFFIYNRPAYATGIGEIMESIDFSLSGYTFVLVKPDVFVSTKEAFSKIVPTPTRITAKEIVAKPVCEWKGLLKNDFEESVFAIHPKIGEIKEKLYTLGAEYASMSGSGSSVFGLFRSDVDLSSNFEGEYYFKETIE